VAWIDRLRDSVAVVDAVSGQRVSADIAQEKAVIPAAADRTAVGHDGPIAETSDADISGSYVQLAIRVGAKWVGRLETGHGRTHRIGNIGITV
jgi:hypothetical protein